MSNEVITVVNTRPAPMLLAYRPPKKGGKGRAPRATGHRLKPGRNDLGTGLGQLDPLVWAQVREDKGIQMQLKAGKITEHSASVPVPNRFDAGKSTVDMDLPTAIDHISDLGSKEDFSLLNEVHIADDRPEVRAAVEARLASFA